MMPYVSQGSVATHVRCGGTFNDKVVGKSKTAVPVVIPELARFYIFVQLLSMIPGRHFLLYFGEISH